MHREQIQKDTVDQAVLSRIEGAFGAIDDDPLCLQQRYMAGNSGIVSSDMVADNGGAQLVHNCGDQEPAYIGEVNGPRFVRRRLFDDDEMYALLDDWILARKEISDDVIASSYDSSEPLFFDRVTEHLDVLCDHSTDVSKKLLSAAPLICYFGVADIATTVEELLTVRSREIADDRATNLEVTISEFISWAECLVGLERFGALSSKILRLYIDMLCPNGLGSSPKTASRHLEQSCRLITVLLQPKLGAVSERAEETCSQTVLKMMAVYHELFGYDSAIYHPDLPKTAGMLNHARLFDVEDPVIL